MSEMHEPGSVTAAAEQAAAAGDYDSAARLLYEALERQEADLGPDHPDLANTLNNLGVVCDMAGGIDEAERCYRRAYAIAAAALAPDHRFVATSRKNLEDFCAAHGRPVDLPRARESSPVPAPAAAAGSFRLLTPAVAGLCALAIVVIVIAARLWPDREKSVRDADSAPVSRAAQPPSPVPPSPTRIEPRPSGTETAVRQNDPVNAPERRAVAPSAPVVPTVVNVLLCRGLSTGARDWHCDPAGRTVDAGPVFYYSRLRSPRATTVWHRWYRGDRLEQEVELSIRANPGVGYRTYSRKAMTAASAGEWRVELRAADGRLLHEARFTVR